MKKIIDFIKKNYIACICVVSVILLVFVFPMIEKRGTFGLNSETTYVTLTCPEKFNSDKQVECDVVVNAPGKNILAVNANYVLPENVEYVSFVVNSESFELYSVDEEGNESENGFAVVNLDGISGETLIGVLTLKLKDGATANSNYTIGLENVELTSDVVLEDESYELIAADDFSTTIRALNNSAILANLSVNESTIELSDDVFEYNHEVSADTETINVTALATDENATISGITLNTDLVLHYGTNNFEIIVISEDGSVINTYTLHVYRAYTFATAVYDYNEELNYVYTRNDDDRSILNNIEKLSSGMRYNISDNNLEVLYGDEVLRSIKILNFSCNYLIEDDNIYMVDDLTRSDLFSKLSSHDLTFKVFDDENNEITDDSAIIEANYTLKVYYNNNEIDSLSLIDEYLVFTDLIIDGNSKIIKRIPLNTTYSELSEKIETSGTVTFKTNDGNDVLDSDVISTGDTVTIQTSTGTFTYTLSVLGDITGNGVVGINDIGTLYRYFRGRITLEDYEIAAGDIFNDGTIAINDVGQLYRYFRERVNTLEGDD